MLLCVGVERLRALRQTAFFWGRLDYRQHPDTQNTSWITAWVGDSERIVAFPSEEPPSSRDPSVWTFQRLAELTDFRSSGARYAARSQTRKRLRRISLLHFVEYRANGCYGRCPAYTARFRSDGSASIETASPNGPRRSRATVPFSRIVAILTTCDFTNFESHYAFRTVDVFGAHLHLPYRDGFSFDADAPDRTQWSTQFQAVSDRIDQVVLDTTWTPQLPQRGRNP